MSQFADDALFDRVGVLVDGKGLGTGTGHAPFAAGELVADAPRTWLAALCSGVKAGAAAARQTAQGTEARTIA